MSFAESLVIAALTATSALFLVAGAGTRRVRRLADIDLRPLDSPPTLTIVIAARQEGQHLRAALTSLLAQGYPAFEVVVVDDRSTDDTGTIADELGRLEPRIHVIHVTSLPDGWLGKTHALHVGATRARGEYLLFTDADVVFAQGTLERAMRLVVSGGIQHLSVVPWITSPSRAVRWLVGAFSIFFVLFTRAWRIGAARSTASIGIGAFNLVKSSTYWDAGGHAPIRLRPDDDLRLGRLLKQTGATSQVWRSGGTVQVDWYPTLGALIRGMEKNTFAALDYRLGAAIASGIGQLLYALAFSTPFLTTGAVRLVAIVDLAVMLAASAAAATLIGQPGICAILQPVALPFFAWVQARAVILTLWRGGIVWRGTFYSLAELRRHRH